MYLQFLLQILRLFFLWRKGLFLMFLIEIELHHVSPPFFPPASPSCPLLNPFRVLPSRFILCVSLNTLHRWESAKLGKKRASDPRELELEADVSPPWWCWELNLGSLQEKYALSTAKSLL